MIRFVNDTARLAFTQNSLRNAVSLWRTSRDPKLRENCFLSGKQSKSFATQLSPTVNPQSDLLKDVIVYKYDNPRFFKLMNIFAVSQFLFWGYLGHWTYTSLRDTKISEEVKADEELSWWRKVNLGEDKYRATLGALCFVVAYLVIFVSWTFTLRSVRYIIARKNGKDVSLVTYTPLGHNRILDVPIKCVSAQESRRSASVYLPLKVKNKAFFYILDMKGEFRNTQLFDQTIAINRKF